MKLIFVLKRERAVLDDMALVDELFVMWHDYVSCEV